MKAEKQIEKIEKIVEVEEPMVTLQMTEVEARRLMVFLGSHTAGDWRRVCLDDCNRTLDKDDNPQAWTSEDTNSYYWALNVILG